MLLLFPCIAQQAQLLQCNSSSVARQRNFNDKNQQRHTIRAPYVEAVPLHGKKFTPAHYLVSASSSTHWELRSRSRIMLRTRTSVTVMAYSQHDSIMVYMACCIATCMLVPVNLTVEP